MAKAPALSTQLKTANTKIMELEKKLKDAEHYKDVWYKYHQEAKNVIEELHTLLDTLPNTVPRKNPDGYNEYSPMIRLASYFANKGNVNG